MDNVKGYIDYVTKGYNNGALSKKFWHQSIGIYVFFLFYIWLAIEGKGIFILLAVVGISIPIISTIVLFIISRGHITLKKDFYLKIIISIDFISLFTLLTISAYTIIVGINFGCLLFFIPPVILPLFLGIKTSMKLKNKQYKIISYVGTTFSCGAGFGVLGMAFGKVIFKDASQMQALIIFAVCSSILSIIFSFGLTSIQKLYYLSKLEKAGIKVDI